MRSISIPRVDATRIGYCAKYSKCGFKALFIAFIMDLFLQLAVCTPIDKRGRAGGAKWRNQFIDRHTFGAEGVVPALDSCIDISTGKSFPS